MDVGPSVAAAEATDLFLSATATALLAATTGLAFAFVIAAAVARALIMRET